MFNYLFINSSRTRNRIKTACAFLGVFVVFNCFAETGPLAAGQHHLDIPANINVEGPVVKPVAQGVEQVSGNGIERLILFASAGQPVNQQGNANTDCAENNAITIDEWEKAILWHIVIPSLFGFLIARAAIWWFCNP